MSLWAPVLKVPKISLYFPGEDGESRMGKELGGGEEMEAKIDCVVYCLYFNCAKYLEQFL